MATIDLGKIKLVWRGTYSGGTAYTVDDVVQHTDGGITSSFICTTNSTGNAPSTGGSVHGSWAYLAKGSGDATLTTQGDILYRDASGNQRLPKGTAGQALKMNTAANAPEWGTISSDWVKLHTVNHSGSNVTSYSFDGHFDDTVYGSYRYVGYHRTATGQSGSTAHSVFRFMVNGSELSTSDYNFAWQSGYYNGSAGDQNRGNHNVAQVRMFNTWNESQIQETPMVFTIDIINPQSTTLRCVPIWTSANSWTGNEIACGVGAMNNEGTNQSSTTKVTGFIFRYENGNNFNLAYGNLYGLKK